MTRSVGWYQGTLANYDQWIEECTDPPERARLVARQEELRGELETLRARRKTKDKRGRSETYRAKRIEIVQRKITAVESTLDYYRFMRGKNPTYYDQQTRHRELDLTILRRQLRELRGEQTR